MGTIRFDDGTPAVTAVDQDQLAVQEAICQEIAAQVIATTARIVELLYPSNYDIAQEDDNKIIMDYENGEKGPSSNDETEQGDNRLKLLNENLEKFISEKRKGKRENIYQKNLKIAKF